MKTLLNWRHQYDVDRDRKEGDNAALTCEDESLTQQHFAKDADINEIARRFGLTEIPLGALDPSLFRDTTNDPDLATILNQHREARDYFMALPAKLKLRFHNSPSELWNFIADPDNAEEAVRLGLLSTSAGDADTTRKSTADTTTTTARATTDQPSTRGGTASPENPPKDANASK